MDKPARRRGVRRGAIVAIGIAALSLAARWHPLPPPRTFSFRYTASITDLPSDAAQVRVWIPLARTRDNQRILSRRIQAAYPYTIHREPAYGNDLLYLALTSPFPPSLDVTVSYDAAVQGGRRIGPGPLVTTPDAFASSDEELILALRDEPWMVVDETTRRMAAEATAGQTSNLGRARAIYDRVIRHMRYDKTTPGWGQGDTQRACLLGRGNCTDFHSLFISLSRSVGIPARFVMGAPVPEEAAEDPVPGYHCWAEFFDDAHGWIPVDASEAWKHPDKRDYYFGALDANRVLISVGRNVELLPRQAGGPVNILVYPYVEADGAPRGTVSTRFWFTSHKEGEA